MPGLEFGRGWGAWWGPEIAFAFETMLFRLAPPWAGG